MSQHCYCCLKSTIALECVGINVNHQTGRCGHCEHHLERCAAGVAARKESLESQSKTSLESIITDYLKS